MGVSRTGATTVAVLLCLAGAGAVTAWMLVRSPLSSSSTEEQASADPIEGVRLGMTPADVRARFARSSVGHFRLGAATEDLALHWSPDRPSDLIRATFEFHSGLLVAIRMTTRDASENASGPAFVVTPGSVLARKPAGPGVTEVTLLSRDCPTHRAEVRTFLSSAHVTP